MTRRLSWRRLVVVIGIIVALILSLSQAFGPIYNTAPDFGGTYAEGIVGSPMAINPLLASFNDPDRDLAALLFSGLTMINGRGEAVPDLAESWQLSDNGRVYTFRLRQSIRWHDGTPFSPQDVAFTVKLIQAPDFPGNPDFALIWKSVRVEILDDLTLRFTLAQPYSSFPSFASVGILPSHLLKDIPVAELAANPFNARPVGTGPFRVKEATIDRFVLERNPDYYGEKPYLSQLELIFYPDSSQARKALNDKYIQGLLIDPNVDRAELAKLRDNGSLKLYTTTSSQATAIFLNLNLPLFKDQRVRQALLYALEREKIVSMLPSGQGQVAQSPFPPNSWAEDSQIKKYSYDLKQAKALMEEAGWQMNQKGIWEKDGAEFRFIMFTNDDPTHIKIGQEVVHQWRLLGLNPDLQTAGWGGLNRDFLAPRNFQAALIGFDAEGDPAGYWHSSQANSEGFNLTSYKNPAVDKALEDARSTTDKSKIKLLYQVFQGSFAEEVPAILLYYPVYTYAINKDIKGVELGVLFQPSSRFTTSSQWYIKTKRAG